MESWPDLASVVSTVPPVTVTVTSEGAARFPDLAGLTGVLAHTDGRVSIVDWPDGTRSWVLARYLRQGGLGVGWAPVLNLRRVVPIQGLAFGLQIPEGRIPN